jgi:putative PEP-CTERM system TPR-repeat lipoprotein
MIGDRFGLTPLMACALLAIAACTPSPDKLLAEARSAIAAGETRTAEIHLKNLLQQQPDNVAARLLLGSVGLSTGDVAGAEQNLRRALDLGADPAAVQLPLVTALLRQNKLAETLEQIARGPALAGPDRVALLRLEGAAHQGLREFPRAEQAYRAALALEPASAEVRTELAGMLVDAGRAPEARELVTAVLTDSPKYVPALLARGGLELTSRDYAAAEATFQQASDLERQGAARSASYVIATAQLVETQLALGKVDAAAGNADTLLAVNARSPISRYVKASVEARRKNLDGAERWLESVVKDAPDYWPAHRLLGAINVEQNQLGQATEYLKTAVSGNPADEGARLQLAEVYIRQGEVEAARTLLAGSSGGGTEIGDALFFAFAGRASRQAGLAEQAAQYFEQSERQAPQNVQQLVGLSTQYVAAGELDRAVRVLGSTSFDDPKSDQLADYLLALVQVRKGDLAAADAVAQRLVESQPKAAWPLNLRATIALAGKDLARAGELLGKAVEIEPRNTGVLLDLARVSAALQKPADAEQYLRRVAEIDRTNTTAIVGLAQLAAARGDLAGAQQQLDLLPPSAGHDRLTGELRLAERKYGAAAEAFERAYDAQPSGTLALRYYSAASLAGAADADAKLRAWVASNPTDPAPNFALGSIALEKGQQEEAVRRFEAVLAASPNHAPTLNNLAWLYSERGDPRAVDFASRAHTADPNNPSIADTLGWLYVRGGDAARGVPLLAEAAAKLPREAEVRYHHGVALAETGNAAKALDELRAALAGAGQAAWSADAQSRFDALQPKP